jgi:hypothetical protein
MKRIITFGEIMMRLNPEGYGRFLQADRRSKKRKRDCCKMQTTPSFRRKCRLTGGIFCGNPSFSAGNYGLPRPRWGLAMTGMSILQQSPPAS